MVSDRYRLTPESIAARRAATLGVGEEAPEIVTAGLPAAIAPAVIAGGVAALTSLAGGATIGGALGAGGQVAAESMLFGDGGGDAAAGELGFEPTEAVFGIGVPEPPQAMVLKEWKRLITSQHFGAWWSFYWRLHDGRTVMYNPSPIRGRYWKVWRDYKSIVIGKSLTTSNVRRVATRLHSHVKSLRKVLKIIK